MADVLGDESNIAGGTSGALQTDFPTSVANVFRDPPKAAMVIEGDFVPGAAANTELEPGTGYDVFPFPALGDAKNVVMGGGDSMIMFRRTRRLRGADGVPRQSRGSRDLGQARRVLARPTGTSRTAPTRTRSREGRQRRSRMPRRSGSTCQISSRRRSAARPARGSGRSCRTSWPTRATWTAPPASSRRRRPGRSDRGDVSAPPRMAAGPGLGEAGPKAVAGARDHGAVPRAGRVLPRRLGDLSDDHDGDPELLRPLR